MVGATSSEGFPGVVVVCDDRTAKQDANAGDFLSVFYSDLRSRLSRCRVTSRQSQQTEISCKNKKKKKKKKKNDATKYPMSRTRGDAP